MTSFEKWQKLAQTYNFLLINPKFNKKNQCGKLKDFFKEISDIDCQKVQTIEHYSIKFKIDGKFKTINLLDAPIFEDKDNFLYWAYEKINKPI